MSSAFFILKINNKSYFITAIVMQPNMKTFPASLLKFDAYLKVTDSLEAAIKVIKDRRLAYGQPCVVTYKEAAPDDNNISGKTSKSSDGTLKHVLMGVGSMDPKNPYIIGIQYDKDGNPVNQEELNAEIMEIIDEFKEKGFTITSIKYSKTEQPNINDTEFSYGDIILGEGAVKQVKDEVLKKSKDLVTSKGIYDFVTRLLGVLEEKVNGIAKDVSVLKADVSTVKVTVGSTVKDVSTLKKDVSIIKATIGSLVHDMNAVKEDVSTCVIVVGEMSKDVSALRNDVSNFYITINSVVDDVSSNTSDIRDIRYDTSVIQLDLNLQKVIIGKLIQDVSALAYDSSHGISTVVSDSSNIVIRTIGRTVGIGLNFDNTLSGNIKLNSDEVLSLYWDKYEEKD
jgi:hypothetical protein